MMEEWNLAISELTVVNITNRIVEPIHSALTPEEGPLNEGEAVFTTSPITSRNALVIHPDEGGPHPCMFDVDVLEHVYKRIININQSLSSRNILEDVRNIRLVCKTWRNVITPLYRRTQASTVFERNRVRYSLPRMKTFLEVMKNSDMIPVQGYKFINDYFREDTDQELLKDFLLTCGSDIVSLHLDFSSHHAREFDLTGLANLKLEKLKKLEFYFQSFLLCKDTRDDQTHGLVPFLELLLNSAEALEEFKFDFQHALSLNAPNPVIKQQFESVICRGLSKTVRIICLPTSRLGERSFNILTKAWPKKNKMDLPDSRKFFIRRSLVPCSDRRIVRFLYRSRPVSKNQYFS